jgi:hypothetical protein
MSNLLTPFYRSVPSINLVLFVKLSSLHIKVNLQELERILDNNVLCLSNDQDFIIS